MDLTDIPAVTEAGFELRTTGQEQRRNCECTFIYNGLVLRICVFLCHRDYGSHGYSIYIYLETAGHF